MSEDEKTGQWDESKQPQNDPLGVIGWVIGGKYKVKSYIGGGGFGEVYDGFNVNLTEQRLVIKFFKKVASRDKFVKEAKILCMLDHPHISRVIDFLPEEGALVVAFIDGVDGGQILKDSGPLSEKMFLNVALAMTSALAYSHSKKIAHRDVKPDNILIDKNEHVYLIDFGIAKVMKEDATKTAYQALTPMFAAPERQTGATDYNPFLSDVYEIGVTLFNFTTNEMPYRNPSNPNINEWGGPAAKRLSSSLKKVLMKATHPDPRKRYQSVQELHDAMEKIKEVYKSGSSKAGLIGAIAAGLVVVAAGVLYFGGFLEGIIPGGSKNRDNPTETVQRNAVREQEIPVVNEEPSEIIIDSNMIATDSAVNNAAAEETAEENQAEPEPKQQEAVAQVEEKKEEEPPPPPPPLPSLRVAVVPEYNVTLMIDGIQRSQNRSYELKKGRHEITVIQPDYPIYTENVNIQVDKSMRINLEDHYASRNEVYFNIGISPPDFEGTGLTINFNGGTKTFGSIPITDLRKLSGKWKMGFDLKAPSGSVFSSAVIDSFVTFPYGGGPRVKINGNNGFLDFSESDWNGLETIGILVYWSK